MVLFLVEIKVNENVWISAETIVTQTVPKTPEVGRFIAKSTLANISFWRPCQKPPISINIACVLKHLRSWRMLMDDTAPLQGVYTTSELDDLTDCLAK